MKKSIKAALFSGLLFPGAGLYLLKLYIRGSIFFVPSLLAIIYLGNGLSAVMDELSVTINANPNLLSNYTLLSNNIQASVNSHIPLYNQAISLFSCAWIISIISSYFAGKKQELADSQTTAAG